MSGINMNALNELLGELVTTVVDKTKPISGGEKRQEPMFQAESEEELAALKKTCGGSILAVAPEGPYVVIPVKGHMRTAKDGATTILVMGRESGMAKRLTFDELHIIYNYIAAGILTIEGSAGELAGSVLVGDVPTVVHMDKPADGVQPTEVGLCIGESTVKKMVSIQEFISISNVEWQSIEGREEVPVEYGIHTVLTQPDDAKDAELAYKSLFHDTNDAAVGLFLGQLGAIGAETTKAGQLAVWMATLLHRDDEEAVLALAVGLAELQDEVVAGVPATNPTVMEVVTKTRYILTAVKELVGMLSAAQVAAVRAKISQLEGTALEGDASTAAVYTRAALTQASKEKAVVEGEVALGGTSPARMAAVLRERAAACEEQAKAKRGDMFGGGTASGAAPGAKASADMAWLVPSEDPEANDKRVIDAIGGTAVVVYVCEGLRGRKLLAVERLTQGTVARFGEDLVWLRKVAVSSPKWMAEPKPPFDFQQPPATWDDAVDRLGYILEMANNTGKPLTIHDAPDAAPGGGPSNASQVDVSGGALALQAPGGAFGPTGKPPFGSTIALKEAKAEQRAHAIPAHTCSILASPGVIITLFNKLQDWEMQEAAAAKAGKPISIGVVTRLHWIINCHPAGGHVRSQILSNQSAACALPGRGEISAVSAMLIQRLKLMISQMYEDTLGVGESGRQRKRTARLVEAAFEGSLEYVDFIEIGAAVSPEEEDNLHAGRLGKTTGDTWPADLERAFLTQAAILRIIYTEVCGAAQFTSTGKHTFHWVPFAQQAGFLSQPSAQRSVEELLGRLNRGIAAVRADERAPMYKPAEDAQLIVQTYMKHEAVKMAAMDAALKAVEGESKKRVRTPQPASSGAAGSSGAAAQGGAKGPNNEANRAKKAAKKAARASGSAGGGGASPHAATPTLAPAAAAGGGGAGNGGAGNGGGSRPAAGGRRLQASDFSFAPGSLTKLLGGQAQPKTGCIEAFEALSAARNNRACGWAALKGQCTKANCQRCASGETADAADVQKVRAAAAPGVL